MSRMAFLDRLHSMDPVIAESAMLALALLRECGQDLQDIPLLAKSVIDERVAQLRTKDVMIFTAQTGSVGDLLAHLWRTNGASSNILGGRFTYAQQETADLLGFEPEKYCRPEVAMAMAARAYWRGKQLAHERGRKAVDVIGLGVTAATSAVYYEDGTRRARRGNDEAHIAVRSDDGFWRFTVGFGKVNEKRPEMLSEAERFAEDRLARLSGYDLGDCPGLTRPDSEVDVFNDMRQYRRRVDEGELIDLFALNAILIAAGIPQTEIHRWEAFSPWLHRRGSLGYEMRLGLVETSAQEVEQNDVIDTHLGTMFGPDGSLYHDSWMVENRAKEIILFPGSFAPLHHGHIGLAEEIARQTEREVVYEISNVNPDKSALSREDLLTRVDQFRHFAPVILTADAPLFIDKARKYPGIPMVVGADTAMRILDKKYYGGTLTGLFRVLDEFDRLGTFFYVVGRKVNDGDGTRVFRTVSDLLIPDHYRHLFRDVTFRADVSSTELREARSDSGGVLD